MATSRAESETDWPATEEYLAKAMDGVKHKAAKFKDNEMHRSKYMKAFLSENSTCLVVGRPSLQVDPIIRWRQNRKFCPLFVEPSTRLASHIEDRPLSI